MMTSPTIGIVGYGVVGKAHAEVFRKKCEVIHHDPKSPESISLDQVAKRADIVFVCVPTPMQPDGSPDFSIVRDTVTRLHYFSFAMRLTTYPIIVVKSAVLPDTMRELADMRFDGSKHPRLCYSPEFLRDIDPEEDLMLMETLIVGGHPDDCQEVQRLFTDYSSCVPSWSHHNVTLDEAALIKYMENCFLALKVSYCNVFYELWQGLPYRTTWETFVAAWTSDERMGESHTMVPGPDGRRGWGGKCLPKDINALIWYGRKLGCDVSILEAAWKYNLTIRPDRDWERIEGAMTHDTKA